MIPSRGHHQLRKGRFSQSGAIYSVTVCCCDKQAVFNDPGNVHIVFGSLDWLGRNGFIDLECCVVMPDHVHLVFRLTGTKDLAGVMKTFKQYSGRNIRQRSGSIRRVWQSQYYDHCLRQDEDLAAAIRYCRYNPVRAGLVSEPEDYPHWRCKYDL